MHKISKPVKIQRDADTSRFTKRIGSTLYKVNVYFSKETSENINDKIFRLAKNELNFATGTAIIKELQTEVTERNRRQVVPFSQSENHERLSGRSSA